jgi:hypothetical protein
MQVNFSVLHLCLFSNITTKYRIELNAVEIFEMRYKRAQKRGERPFREVQETFARLILIVSGISRACLVYTVLTENYLACSYHGACIQVV